MLQKATINGREVEYDDTEFKLVKSNYASEEFEDIEEYLEYIGDGTNITNPKGNTIAIAMFAGYKGEYIDLSNFDSSEITRMDDMFACSNLKVFNSKLDMRNVESVQTMFEGCDNLLVVDMSKCDFSNVQNYRAFCADCPSLVSVTMGIMSKEYDIDVLSEELDDLFLNCPHISTVNAQGLKGVFTSKTIDSIFGERLYIGCECKVLSNEKSIISSNDIYKCETTVYY